MKKTVSILLVLASLILLFGCAGRGEEAATTEETVPQVTETAEATDDETTAVAFDKYDFGSETVSILYWSDVENPEFFVEDETGEVVNDTIYRRNLRVEDAINVKLSYTGTKGNYDKANDFLTYVKNSVNNGSGDPFSIVAAYSLSAGMLAYNGLCLNMKHLEPLHYESEWWPDSLLETATVNDRLYFVSGDISTNLLYMMYAMYYNKDMVGSLHLDDPFSFVESGDWTLDKMIELSAGIYADTDGNGSLSSGDTFAQACYALHLDAFLTGSGILCADVKDGKLVIDEDFAGQKMVDLTDKIYEYVHSKDAEIISGYKDIFKYGRSLFITDRSDIAIFDIKDKEFEMGILPIPKYDANQEDYLTVIGNPFTLYSMPINAPDENMSAAVLEYLAHYSYEELTPAIFELSLKTRYADGGNDVTSYDILRRGIVYDLGRIFAKVFEGTGSSPGTLYSNQIKTRSSAWTRVYSGASSRLSKALNNINAAFGIN